MAKPQKEIIFRPIEGTWIDVTGDSGHLPRPSKGSE